MVPFPILWLSGQRAVHTIYDVDVRFGDGLKYEIFLINSTPELWKFHFTAKNIQKQLTPSKIPRISNLEASDRHPSLNRTFLFLLHNFLHLFCA